MARYIDADKVMEEINRIGGHNLCEWETIGVKALIDRQPTADVAPKSEVAREIIDDFDEELHKLAERYYEQGKIEYFTLCEVIYNLVIAKIKKKYTEEKE